MVDLKKNYEEDPRFANWNTGYNNIFEHIEKTHNVVFMTRISIKDKIITNSNLNTLHSAINTINNTYSNYIDKSDENIEQLNKLYEKLNDKKYLQLLEMKKYNLFKYQYLILTELEDIWRNINVSLSNKGITIKVVKTNNKDPGKAILSGYN